MAIAQAPTPASHPVPLPPTAVDMPETVLPQVETDDEVVDDAVDDVEEIPLVEEEAAKKDLTYQSKKDYWSKPIFSNQTDAVGWSENVFQTPPGFQRRVQFWVDIYTKYTTHQALLHDARYMGIVYKTFDFTDIEKNQNLSAYDIQKEKKKRVKEEKKKIKEELLHLQKNEFASDLTADEREIAKKFRFITEKNKFYAAAQRGRLRMQLGQKDRFLQGIYFSGRYIREMEKIFKEENVPMELTRLPFVESSFNLYAFSHVGASGIWQFMRSTGKLYKLKIDQIKDLRNDPLAATRAAAQMLKFNFKLLGTWPLALTAYNHGPQGVARCVKDLKSTDINQIVWNTTRRRFGFASENFYAEFLAALEVESHANTYFGKVQVSPPLEYEEIQLPRAMRFGELALAMKNKSSDPVEKARVYNPYFSRAVLSGRRKIDANYTVRIPKNYKDKFVAQIQNIDPVQVKSLEVKSGMYKILPGDTLSTISKEFGISLKELLQANGLRSVSLLRPGQNIVIPTLENR